MKLANVTRMDAREVATRGRQEILKWLERTGTRQPGGRPVALDPVSSAGQDLRVRHPLFAGAQHAQTPVVLASRFPAEAKALKSRAEGILRGQLDLPGYPPGSRPGRIDWLRDPVSGRRAPLTHWSRINPLDAAAVGNVKLVWELNRHQWMVTLGQAYRLTGDGRYAAAAADHWRNWLRANPPGLGINWTSGLELSFRLIAWCWTLALLDGSDALPPELVRTVVESIRAHATQIERYLSRYSSPNTHLTGEALGLVYTGAVFPDLPSASRWRALGESILLDESVRQVREDGVHFEQSTCYHRYSVEIFLHLLLIGPSSGGRAPSGLETTVGRMVDFLAAVCRPDGSDPGIGDADGGSLLPLGCRPVGDLRGVFAASAAILSRPEHAVAAGGAAPELLWLLGPDGPRRVDAMRPARPAAPRSRHFPKGGYVVLRGGPECDRHHAIFDVGPLGCPVSGAHGHADLLSFQCTAFGTPFLVDAGTYCYASEPQWRSYFRATRSHNTVIVDGRDQAVPAGPFSWKDRPGVSRVRFDSADGLVIAEGEHDAYGNIRHARRVAFVRHGYWVIVDEIDGDGVHDVELRWQFAPMAVDLEPSGWIRARGPDGHALLLAVLPQEGTSLTLRSGACRPAAGWVSSDFGTRQPAPMATASARVVLPHRVITILWPVEDAFEEPPALRPIADAQDRLAGCELQGGADVIALGPAGLRVRHEGGAPCAASPE
jgi:hypothetical protein